MIKGGYKIIDLKDTAIDTTNGTTITGIHDALENNYRKPLILSGIVIDGTEYADAPISVTNADGTFSFTAYGKTYTVTADDLVKIA